MACSGSTMAYSVSKAAGVLACREIAEIDVLRDSRASSNEVSCANARAQGPSQRCASGSSLDRMGGPTHLHWRVRNVLTFR